MKAPLTYIAIAAVCLIASPTASIASATAMADPSSQMPATAATDSGEHAMHHHGSAHSAKELAAMHVAQSRSDWLARLPTRKNNSR